jgi:hypothetical protein
MLPQTLPASDKSNLEVEKKQLSLQIPSGFPRVLKLRPMTRPSSPLPSSPQPSSSQPGTPRVLVTRPARSPIRNQSDMAQWEDLVEGELVALATDESVIEARARPAESLIRKIDAIGSKSQPSFWNVNVTDELLTETSSSSLNGSNSTSSEPESMPCSFFNLFTH